MNCSACSSRVERCVRQATGIQEVQVNLLTASMQVEYDADATNALAIAAVVEAAGYGAKEMTTPGTPLKQDNQDIRRRLILSFAFLLPMTVLHHTVPGDISRACQCLLVLPILWLNRRFFSSGFKAVLQKAPNMDTLVALGAAAGLLYTAVDYLWLHSGTIYAEAAGMILTLITLGKWLESRATVKTASALEQLRQLLPDTATKYENGQLITIPAAGLRPGDVLHIAPGCRVPADGKVIEGVSAIDEAALTGESLPTLKEAGHPVFAGTINGEGLLRVCVTHSREDSSLSHIIRLVGEAAASKAPIARMADSISGIFVPIVVVLSLLTATLWILFGASAAFAIGCAISVLVVSCPCALGLATPVAIMTGAGKGAERGILFRQGAALEKARNTGVVILDKTGTITLGRPMLSRLLPEKGVAENELLLTAVALESSSKHPLAKAITKAGSHLPAQSPAESLQYLPGRGISGTLAGVPCMAGNRLLMQEHGIRVDEAMANTLARQGETPIYIVKDSRLLGCITLTDPIKPTGKQAIEALRSKGIRVIMMTGDHPLTAQAIADQAGIREFHAEALPTAKADLVSRLRKQGENVMMVGDGINDAPALMLADTGVAIGSGADAALCSADIILMHNDLMDLPATLELSQAVIRNIRQNLFWAFFYNCLMIPLAAGVLYPPCGILLSPTAAAAAMSISSICVVLNALRLRKLSLSSIDSSHMTTNTTLTLCVEGMMCPHCERHVCQALTALPGVEDCRADHNTGSVQVTLSAKVEEALLRETITKAGYTLCQNQTS